MAVEWMICSKCGRTRKRTYRLSDGPESVNAPASSFGEHNNGDKRCPGSDKPPKRTYWGDSIGMYLPDAN